MCLCVAQDWGGFLLNSFWGFEGWWPNWEGRGWDSRAECWGLQLGRGTMLVSWGSSGLENDPTPLSENSFSGKALTEPQVSLVIEGPGDGHPLTSYDVSILECWIIWAPEKKPLYHAKRPIISALESALKEGIKGRGTLLSLITMGSLSPSCVRMQGVD